MAIVLAISLSIGFTTLLCLFAVTSCCCPRRRRLPPKRYRKMFSEVVPEQVPMIGSSLGSDCDDWPRVLEFDRRLKYLSLNLNLSAKCAQRRRRITWFVTSVAGRCVPCCSRKCECFVYMCKRRGIWSLNLTMPYEIRPVIASIIMCNLDWQGRQQRLQVVRRKQTRV